MFFLRIWLKKLCLNFYFNLLFICLAFGVAMIQATDTINASPRWKSIARLVHFSGCCVFTFELMIRATAYGIVGKNGILNFKWTRLDSMVLCTQWGAYLVPGIPNLVALKALHILRPLSNLRPLHKSKIVITTASEALADMGSVAALTLFIILLFGVMGIDMFGTAAKQRGTCAVVFGPADMDILNGIECNDATCLRTVPPKLCTPPATNSETVSQDTGCSRHVTGAACVRLSYPNSDQLHGWEHMGSSFLSVTRTLYLKGFTTSMREATETAGVAMAIPFFILLIVFGSFCVLNLTVATTSKVYGVVKGRLNDELQKELYAEALAAARKAELKEAAERMRDPQEVPIIFNRRTAFRIWMVSPLMLVPVGHLMYLKRWDLLRGWKLFTLNFFFIGWIMDGCKLQELAEEADRSEYIRQRKRSISSINRRIEKYRRQSRPPTTALLLMQKILYHPSPLPLVQYIQQSEHKLRQAMQDIVAEQLRLDGANADAPPPPATVGAGEEDDNQSDDMEESINEDNPPYFERIMDLVVIVNTISMMLGGQSSALDNVLYIVEWCFGGIFILEALVKIIALRGFKNYFRSPINTFDFVVILLSTVGDIWALFSQNDYARLLGSTRALRVLKLVRRFQGMRSLIAKSFGGPSFVVFTILVCLGYIFFGGMIAIELFGQSAEFEKFTGHFFSLDTAALGMFEFMTGEGYQKHLVAASKASFVGVPFLLLFYFVGNFVFLRMFIALILSNFEIPEEQKIELQKKRFFQHQVESGQLLDGQLQERPFDVELHRLKGFDPEDDGLDESKKQWLHKVAKYKVQEQEGAPLEEKVLGIGPKVDDEDGLESERSLSAILERIVSKLQPIVDSMAFDLVVLSVVLFSTVTVIAQLEGRPFFEGSTDRLVELIFFLFFACELFLNGIVNGFIFPYRGRDAILRDFWGILDSIVVVIMALEVSGITVGKGVMAVRIVRVLRPLQKVGAESPMSLMVAALSSSLDEILYTLNFLLLIMIIFAIAAMELFGGRMARCSNVQLDKSDCFGQYLTSPADSLGSLGILVPNVWASHAENFDNIQNAAFSLLRVLSGDGWTDLLHNSMAVTTVNEAPGPATWSIAAIFFAVYLVLCNVFVSQLVIGTLIVNLRLASGSALYTEEQRIFVATKKNIHQNLKRINAPKEPGNKVQLSIYRFITSPKLDAFMMTVIVLNTFFMAANHHPTTASWRQFAGIVDNVFLTTYTIEMVLKLAAFGVIGYCKDAWNLFDGIVVSISIMQGWIFPLVGISSNLSFFKVLRAVRVLRLVRRAPDLQRIVTTLVAAVPSVLSGLLLMIIWTSIFAAIGMQYFRNVRYGQLLDHRDSFQSFGDAFLALFRILVGDGWWQFTHDMSVQPPQCEGLDCGQIWAVGFLLIYWAGINFFFLPVLIAALINYFFDAAVDSTSLVKQDDMEIYALVWKHFDLENAAKIPIMQLRPFLSMLKDKGCIMGFHVSRYKQKFKEVEKAVMMLPDSENGTKAPFFDTAIVLASRLMDPKPMTATDFVGVDIGLDGLKAQVGLQNAGGLYDHIKHIRSSGEIGHDSRDPCERLFIIQEAILLLERALQYSERTSSRRSLNSSRLNESTSVDTDDDPSETARIRMHQDLAELHKQLDVQWETITDAVMRMLANEIFEEWLEQGVDSYCSKAVDLILDMWNSGESDINSDHNMEKDEETTGSKDKFESDIVHGNEQDLSTELGDQIGVKTSKAKKKKRNKSTMDPHADTEHTDCADINISEPAPTAISTSVLSLFGINQSKESLKLSDSEEQRPGIVEGKKHAVSRDQESQHQVLSQDEVEGSALCSIGSRVPTGKAKRKKGRRSASRLAAINTQQQQTAEEEEDKDVEQRDSAWGFGLGFGGLLAACSTGGETKGEETLRTVSPPLSPLPSNGHSKDDQKLPRRLRRGGPRRPKTRQAIETSQNVQQC